jgi:hypothetical protein
MGASSSGSQTTEMAYLKRWIFVAASKLEAILLLERDSASSKLIGLHGASRTHKDSEIEMMKYSAPRDNAAMGFSLPTNVKTRLESAPLVAPVPRQIDPAS